MGGSDTTPAADIGVEMLHRAVMLALMLNAYLADKPSSQLHELPQAPKVDELVWVDLLNATPEEVSAAEQTLGIVLPTVASLSEIEHSSRMRWSGDAMVLSLPLPIAATGGYDLAPVGFVVRQDVLVTLRIDANEAFDQFADTFRGGTFSDRSPISVMIGLFETIVDALADRLEEIGTMLDRFAGRIFRAGARQKTKHRAMKIDSNALRDLLRQIGGLGQVLGKLRASLLTAGRIVPFVQTEAKDWVKEGAANRLTTVKADVASLNEYEAHLSEKVQFLLDAALGLINMDQNDSFKVLTVVSVVGIPPTLVASIYGMNFHSMPELAWTWGYPYGLGVIVLSAVIPLLWFKAKGWF
jgi:magnesium transporter